MIHKSIVFLHFQGSVRLGESVDMAGALLCVFHFVLIHGACHGSWAWYRLEDHLTRAGHKVTSLDMTGAGINLADPDTVTTWEEYNKPALDFFQALPERAPNEKVVLVGHSMGGFTNLMLMERFSHKIDLAVFVAAVVTRSGLAYFDDTGLLALMTFNSVGAYNYKNGAENPPTSFYFPTSALQDLFYNGIDSEIFVLASKLVRPVPMRMQAEPVTYTKERHGQVPAVYIRYLQDNTVRPAAQEYIVTHYGPFREVVLLEGGHFNFLQRPREFTKLLAKLAKKYTR